MIIDAPFSQGVDESTQPELLDPKVSATKVHNLVQVRRGATRKPLGVDYLATTRISDSARSSGRRLVPFRGEIGTVDSGGKHDAYSTTALSSTTRGTLPSCTILRTPSGAAAGQAHQYVDDGESNGESVYDVAYCNGYMVAVYAWRSDDSTANDELRYVVTDANSKETVVVGTVASVTLSTTGWSPRSKLCVVDNIVYVVYEQNTNTLYANALDCTDGTSLGLGFPALSAISVTAATATWNGNDFDTISDGSTNWYLVFTRGSNVYGVQFTGLTVSLAAPIATGTGAARVACEFRDSTLFVAVRDTAQADVDLYAVDPASMSITSTLLVLLDLGTFGSGETERLGVFAETDNSIVVVGYHMWFSQPLVVLTTRRANYTAGVLTAGSAQVETPGVAPLSRPFKVGSLTYLWAWHHSCETSSVSQPVNGQAVVALLDISNYGDGFVRAAALPMPRLNAFGYRGVPPDSCQHVAVLSATANAMLLPRKVSAVSTSFDWVSLDFADVDRWQNIEAGGGVLFSGAVASAYDGVKNYESAFLTRPAIAFVDTPAGSLTGNYFYAVIFEYTDASGQITWSAPSDPYEVTLASEDVEIGVAAPVTNRFQALPIGAQTRVRAILYRTENNGTVYYRTKSVDATGGDPLVITITDDMADVTLIEQQKLYGTGLLPTTVGAAQPRACPPGLRAVWRHGDRAMGIGDDARTIWYSAPYLPGETLWWGDVFQFTVDSRERLTAGTSMDGNAIIFSPSEIFIVSGDGPPDSGGNGTEFSLPRRIASDVGCISQRSMCLTSDGVFFQSRRGLELLTRGLGVAWIGEPVQQTLSDYPVIAAVVLDPLAQRVSFYCAASETDGIVSGNARVVVYDLTTKTWATMDRVFYPSAYQSAQDACMHVRDGRYRHHMIDADGYVWQEKLETDSNAYLSAFNPTFPNADFVSGTYMLAGMTGYVAITRMQLLLKRYDNHDLNVEFAFDDETSYDASCTRTFTAADLAALSDGHLDIIPARFKCRSVRVRLTDSAPANNSYTTTGRGSDYYGLSIAYEPMDGVTRKPSTAR
jgi:hypothetical protein